jgi:hypothetical protein
MKLRKESYRRFLLLSFLPSFGSIIRSVSSTSRAEECLSPSLFRWNLRVSRGMNEVAPLSEILRRRKKVTSLFLKKRKRRGGKSTAAPAKLFEWD